jgi:hypothetical protein
MGKRTGRPRGRPVGVKNKHTLEREAQLAELAEKATALIAEPFDGDAQAFLMFVYKDPSKDMHLRIDAAKAAIRYEKPALQAVEHMGKVGGPIQSVTMSPTEFEAIARRLLDEI